MLRVIHNFSLFRASFKCSPACVSKRKKKRAGKQKVLTRAGATAGISKFGTFRRHMNGSVLTGDKTLRVDGIVC